MNASVKIEIEVTPEAAEALADGERRRRVGEIVSRLVRPASPEEDPLIAVLRDTQAAAAQAGLTEAAIDAELAAYNAERRS